MNYSNYDRFTKSHSAQSYVTFARWFASAIELWRKM